jgi:hypothetical protein
MECHPDREFRVEMYGRLRQLLAHDVRIFFVRTRKNVPWMTPTDSSRICSALGTTTVRSSHVWSTKKIEPFLISTKNEEDRKR